MIDVMAAETTSNPISEDEFVTVVTSACYPAPTTAQYQGMCAGPRVGRYRVGGFGAVPGTGRLGSDGRQTKEEPGAVQSATSYDAANGKFFYGRGYIPLTWGANYQAASKDLYGDDRLHQDPATTPLPVARRARPSVQSGPGRRYAVTAATMCVTAGTRY